MTAKEKIRKLYDDGSGVISPTNIAKIVYPDLDPRVARKRVSRFIEKINANDVKPEKIKERKTEESPKIEESPKFILSAWNQSTGKMMDIDEYCELYRLPRTDIREYKLVTHTGTPYYNIRFKDQLLSVSDVMNVDFIEGVVSKYIGKSKSVKKPDLKKKKISKTVRGIITDIHVGMSPNIDGNSLFGGSWNEKELIARMDDFANSVIDKLDSGCLNDVIIDDLGDFMDGWEGETTRKGHELPQNMTTAQCFDAGVRFKVELIDKIIDSGYDVNVTMNNICNDNHAGVFGYVVNSAVKSILEAKYSAGVTVNNHQKFMCHYFVGRHCFILCHGKDDKHLKFGFKTDIDDKGISKIDQYIKLNDLYQQASWFEFSKGDSHQMLFDYSSSDDFNYMNYPAFSPSSDWVQTNFKRGNSGFVIQVIDPNKQEIDISYKLFKWKK